MIEDLNKNFESRVRLGIMALLIVDDWVDFSQMKETLQLTDGNLSSHISALEKLEYIEIKKDFVGKKPRTQYRITQLGRLSFQNHLKALEDLIKLI